MLQPAQIAKLTDVNGDVLAGMKIGKTEELAVTSSGGAKVQAWIVKPLKVANALGPRRSTLGLPE